jgi:hypothetical protein
MSLPAPAKKRSAPSSPWSVSFPPWPKSACPDFTAFAQQSHQLKYEAIIADYNREKDRNTIEETFRRWLRVLLRCGRLPRGAQSAGFDRFAQN